MTDKHPTLICPLCGHDDYLLSEHNQFLCATCGTFFDDVASVVATQVAPVEPAAVITPNSSVYCH